MGRYIIGQGKSDTSSSDDDDDAYFNENGELGERRPYVFGERRDEEYEEHVETETKGVMTVTSPLPDIVVKKKRRNTLTKPRIVLES